jgi:hypothetical protein
LSYSRAKDPLSERYLDQIRIMRKGTLQHLFQAGPEAAEIATQPITLGAFIEQYLAEQKAKWFNRGIYGTFGGDGDWAKEDLCFGFMVENNYWGVHRLWSRAWLVTK